MSTKISRIFKMNRKLPLKQFRQWVKEMGSELFGIQKGVNKLVPISLCLQAGNKGGKGKFWIEVKLQLVIEVYSFTDDIAVQWVTI